MGKFPIADDEAGRLNALARYNVLDTERQASFDRLTELARRIMQTPIALISLVDDSRQWFKSCIGLDVRETPRELAFCTYTILSHEPLIVTDATKDCRFAHNPLVTGPPHIRFYLGAPLISSDGFRLGSLCTIDTKAREYPSERDILCLQDLAAQVVEQLETLRTTHQLMAAHRNLLKREEELQEQRREAFHLKNQVDLALEAGEMGTWEWDESSDFVYRSSVTNRLLGYSDPECVGTRADWLDRIHPADRPEILRKIRACRDSGVELHADYRIVLPNGTLRWLSGRARQRLNLSRQSVGLVGVCWDITERKAAEQRLLEKQEMERGWSAASAAGMFRTDANGTMLFANERCQQMFDKSPEDFQHWHSFIHPDDLPGLLEEWEKCVRHGSGFHHEHRVVCVNSALRWIHMRVVPLHTNGGDIAGFLGTLDDITAKKEAQQGLAGLQQLLQLAVDTMPQRLFWKDRNSIYQGCNKAFASDLGLSEPSDVIGKSDFELAHPDYAEQFRAADRQIMTSGLANLDYEEEVTHRNGSRCLIRSSNIPLRASDGTVVGILATYDDVTEQRRKEEELLHARDAAESAARAKGQFLANMSHEIRTPLNGVLGMISLLLDSPLGGEQRKWTETAQASGEALLRLLNNVLDLSKAEAGKLDLESVPFDLFHTVEQCTELFEAEARSKGLALSVEFTQSTPPQVVGDGTRIRQILTNFIANAVKFTPRGEIKVHVSSKDVSHDEMLLRLVVQDSGIGVPSTAEAHLFQPFSQADGSTTRRFGGTGLGLSIAKQLTELMCGSIGYRPNPTHGSTFWVELPIGKVREFAPETMSVVPSFPALERRHILIVEDNPINQLVTSRFIAKLGCAVDIASNGREALELWQQRPYDLILMDGQMPELDGYQATRQLRQLEQALNRKRVPVIALTAHALPGDKERCLDAGMDDYLSKPVHQESLKRTVVRWLQQGPEPLNT